ncbi:MAG: tetratricopeptide repeat protein [Planctomycetota bacterium]|nr:MAG: tetratricopeptide repeat protein [Planctomycetota bacterium]
MVGAALAGGCVPFPTDPEPELPPQLSPRTPWRGLFELALALAREDRPALEPRAARARLRALALRCEAELERTGEEPARAIARVLFDRRTGLAPAVVPRSELDPATFDVDRVLATGRGACLPIAIVALAVCEQLGLEALPLLSPTHAAVWIEPGRVLDPALGGLRIGPLGDARRGRDRPASPDEVAAALLANRAAVRRAAGRVEAARLDLERALELVPESFTARLNLAVALLDLGEHERARALLEELEASGASSALVAYNLGVLAAREGTLGVARHWYRIALERDPKLVAAHVNLGAVCLALEDREAARAAFAAALALDPDNARARDGLRRTAGASQ